MDTVKQLMDKMSNYKNILIGTQVKSAILDLINIGEIAEYEPLSVEVLEKISANIHNQPHGSALSFMIQSLTEKTANPIEAVLEYIEFLVDKCKIKN